jgi:putative transposase
VFITPHHPTIVLLTVCTKDRKPWLASDEVHIALLKTWRDSSSWIIGRYVVLPDHLHLFCAPKDLNHTLETWVRFWKSRLWQEIPKSDRQWEAHHWDTRLRQEESYAA